MVYLGGKRIISRWVAENIQRHKGRAVRYVEPFVGGLGTFERCRPLFASGMASDTHEDLILLYQAIASGWIPPETVTEQEYQVIRQGPPSALRGFVGFGCSFGGKWFGGYARNKQGFNYARIARDSLLRSRSALASSDIRQASYEALPIDSSCFVYCDPPYAGTTGYSTGEFNHDRFWATVEGWARLGAVVLVSEETAPGGWDCVAEKTRGHRIGNTCKPFRTEKLWMLAP